MNTNELGVELTKLDQELLNFIRQVDVKKQKIIASYSQDVKYPNGYQFQHPEYGSAIVVGVHVFENKQLVDNNGISLYDDPYCFFETDSFYKPFYLYECKVFVEGLGEVITTVPEYKLDK